jgi:ABC-type phosphate/phosphonate transport system substrate-binding protein
MSDAAPFAALRMYDLPEIVPAVEALGRAILSRIPGAPRTLQWEGDVHAQWSDPRLVLGQTCGWPLMRDLADRVGVVGAFTYRCATASAHAPCYRSVLVARDERLLASFAASRAAVNSFDSLSGYVSLAVAVAPITDGHAFFRDVVVTGSHHASVTAVRNGDADLAAIDGVTFALLRAHRPAALDGLHIVGHGPMVPTLPLITAGDVHVVRAAVAAALDDAATADARHALLIERFVPLALEDYSCVTVLADQASVAIARSASNAWPTTSFGMRRT